MTNIELQQEATQRASEIVNQLDKLNIGEWYKLKVPLAPIQIEHLLAALLGLDEYVFTEINGHDMDCSEVIEISNKKFNVVMSLWWGSIAFKRIR